MFVSLPSHSRVGILTPDATVSGRGPLGGEWVLRVPPPPHEWDECPDNRALREIPQALLPRETQRGDLWL